MSLLELPVEFERKNSCDRRRNPLSWVFWDIPFPMFFPFFNDVSTGSQYQAGSYMLRESGSLEESAAPFLPARLQASVSLSAESGRPWPGRGVS
jgi:hypothetical protein